MFVFFRLAGGYQQPLAPPSHMHNYKMGSGGPQGPLHPGNMIPNPAGGPPYSQIPPSHQPFNQQGEYENVCALGSFGKAHESVSYAVHNIVGVCSKWEGFFPKLYIQGVSTGNVLRRRID